MLLLLSMFISTVAYVSSDLFIAHVWAFPNIATVYVFVSYLILVMFMQGLQLYRISTLTWQRWMKRWTPVNYYTTDALNICKQRTSLVWTRKEFWMTLMFGITQMHSRLYDLFVFIRHQLTYQVRSYLHTNSRLQDVKKHNNAEFPIYRSYQYDTFDNEHFYALRTQIGMLPFHRRPKEKEQRFIKTFYTGDVYTTFLSNIQCMDTTRTFRVRTKQSHPWWHYFPKQVQPTTTSQFERFPQPFTHFSL